MLSALYLTKTNATDDILKEQFLYQIDFFIFMFPSLYEKNKVSLKLSCEVLSLNSNSFSLYPLTNPFHVSGMLWQ